MKKIPNLVIAFVAISLVSCVEPYGANGYQYRANNNQTNQGSQYGQYPRAQQPRNQPKPANIQWVFHPSDPTFFVMKVRVNGKLHNVDQDNWEYFGNKPASPGSNGIPRSAISGYFVNGPDGEWIAYYAMREGNQIGIFRQDANPYGSLPRPRRVYSINL